MPDEEEIFDLDIEMERLKKFAENELEIQRNLADPEKTKLKTCKLSGKKIGEMKKDEFNEDCPYMHLGVDG